MRSRSLALLVAVLLGAGASVALSACGDEGGNVDLAKTVRTTSKKGTARTSMHIRISGLGLAQPLVLTAKGVTSLGEPRARLTLDLGPLLTLVGASRRGDRDLELIADGSEVYVRPPRLRGLTVPGGRSWITLDLASLARAAGLRTQGLGDLVTLEPASQLRALKASEGMEEVGKEEVDGVETTHFRGSYRLSDFVDELPARKRASARRSIEELKRVGGKETTIDDPIPADIWIDAAGVTRRMRSASKLPAGAGTSGGYLVFDYSLHDFGAELDTTAPPRSEVYDVTRSLSRAVGGQTTRRSR